MADRSPIEWTDATWNPIVGCSIVSPGCTNCFAMRLAAWIERMQAATLPAGGRSHYSGLTHPSKAGPVWSGEVRLAPESVVTAPLRWRRPRRVFVNSMGDLFHESVPDEWIDRVFAVMAVSPQHTFQVLTKRSARMRRYLQEKSRDPSKPVMVGKTLAGTWPWPHVWLGVSAEDQARADERIPDLLATPAAVRFVSAEPLLGPINLRKLIYGNVRLDSLTGACTAEVTFSGGFGNCQAALDSLPPLPERRLGLDWIIAGGESGKDARPMHPDWPRAIRDDCAAAGVPFFFKQWGEWGLSDRPGPEKLLVAKDYISRHDWPNVAFAGRMTDCNHFIPAWRLEKVGKRRAGRLLDGVAHDAFPERAR